MNAIGEMYDQPVRINAIVKLLSSSVPLKNPI